MSPAVVAVVSIVRWRFVLALWAAALAATGVLAAIDAPHVVSAMTFGAITGALAAHAVRRSSGEDAGRREARPPTGTAVRGRSPRRERELEALQAQLESALTDADRSFAAWALADALIARNAVEDGLAVLDREGSSAPPEWAARALVMKAHHLELLGRGAEAEAAYAAAVDLPGGRASASAAIQLAALLEREGRYAEARDVQRRAEDLPAPG